MSGVLWLTGGRKPAFALCAWCVCGVCGVCVPCCVLLVFSCCVSGVGQGPVQRRAVLSSCAARFTRGQSISAVGPAGPLGFENRWLLSRSARPSQARHVSLNPRSPPLSGRAAGAATLLVGGWASVHDTRTVVCSRRQPVVHPHRCMAFRQEFQCSACALGSNWFDRNPGVC